MYQSYDNWKLTASPIDEEDQTKICLGCIREKDIDMFDNEEEEICITCKTKD